MSALLESEGIRALLAGAPRSLVVGAIREAIETARHGAPPPSDEQAWAAAVSDALERARRPSLRPVINATGVVLHTNLGRAPLAEAALEAIQRVASGYSNLEYDLERGERGSRYVHCASLLRELTGAEDAVVVNNGAAALVLALNTLASGRDAIVSRGELVEIGGSFRIPEIMERSGARLVEVGTTNRTRAEDYRAALGERTGAIVKVHRSNFAMLGFVAEASVADLAALSTIPVIHDLGSGLLVSLESLGLSGEPTARDALAAGAALVTMSGDKLLGGPQAGIVVGGRTIIDALRRNPLARSYRVDKLTLAALEATLALYREPERALREIPTLAMLGAAPAALRARAERIAHSPGIDETRLRIVESEASVGGGAFPTARLPSIALSLGGDAAGVERRLRRGDPPVIGRVADARVLLDLRTVLPTQDELLAAAVRRVLEAGGSR